MEHTCQHETDLALIQNAIPRLEEKLDKINTTLSGNGNPGLKTVQELHEQSIKRLWLTVGGTWLGAIALLIIKSLLGE